MAEMGYPYKRETLSIYKTTELKPHAVLEQKHKKVVLVWFCCCYHLIYLHENLWRAIDGNNQ